MPVTSRSFLFTALPMLAVLGPEFTANVGRWVGAKVGIFAAGPGHADFDWFRITAAP